MFEGGWQPYEVSEEERRKQAIEHLKRKEWIEQELGMTEGEFLSAVAKEVQELESKDQNTDDILSVALENVADRQN